MAFNIPPLSEPELANQPTNTRLAVLIDLMQDLITAVGGSVAAEPEALDADEVTVGGTPVVAATGPVNGGYITNDNESDNLFIDMVGDPVNDPNDVPGTTTTLLYPGSTFTIPKLATGVEVKVNATNSGAKISGVKW